MVSPFSHGAVTSPAQCSPPVPPCSAFSEHSTSARPRQRARVLGRETGEGLCAGGAGGLICRDSRVVSPPLVSEMVAGGPWQQVSWPPSCSCCTPTCSSGTSAEWRSSGCAVRCRSAETGHSFDLDPHHRVNTPVRRHHKPPGNNRNEPPGWFRKRISAPRSIQSCFFLPVRPAAGGGAESENGVVDVEPGCA